MKIKTLLATCLLLLGMQTASAETIDGQNIISSDLSNSAGKITNCQFSASAIKGGDSIDLSSFDITMTICKEDVAYGMWNELFGNVGPVADVIGQREVEKQYGYDKEVKGSLIFQYVLELFREKYLFIFGLSSIVAIAYFLWARGREDDSIAANSHRPVMVLVGILVINFLYALLKLGVIWSIGFTNMMSFAGVINSLKMFDEDSQVLTTQDEMTISTNTNQMIAMKFAKEQTKLAQVSQAFSYVKNNQAAFFSLEKDYSFKELLSEMKTYNTYDPDKDRYYTVGFDITNISDMLNPNILVNSYDMIKKSPYLDANKKIFGYEAILGSVDVNSNGVDFEDISNESLNDGVLKNQMNSVLIDSKALSVELKSDVDAIYEKIYAHLKERQPLYTDDYSRNTFLESDTKALQDKTMSAAKQIVQKNVNLDALSMSSPATTGPLVVALGYANVFAAIQGHDKSGDGITRIIDMQGKIYDAEKNKYCTLHYKENEASRAFVKESKTWTNDSLYNLNRNAAFKELRNKPGFNCIGVDLDKQEFFNYGSPTIGDVEEYRIIEIAYKAAFDITLRNYFVGLKRAAASDKALYNSLFGEIIEVSKLGFIGSIGLVQQKISLFKKNEKLKNAQIANAVSWSYRNANGDETNYIMHNALNEKVTTDNIQKLNQDSLVEFPAISLTNLNIVGIVNVSPSRLDDSSLLSGQSVKAILLKMLALDPTPIKLYLGTDPNKSLPAGARECQVKPDICKNRVRTPLSQAVNEMGMGWRDWAEAMLVAKFVFAGASFAVENVSDVTSKVTSVVGEDGAKGIVKSTVNFFLNLPLKIALIALQAGNVLLSLLTPFIMIMLMAGIFVAHIIPIMMILVFINILITVITSAGGQAALSIPIRCIRLPLLEKSQAWAEVRNMIDDVLALIFTLPFAAFFAMLAIYMMDTIDLSGPGIYLIASSDSSLIGGLMKLVSFFFLCVFVIISLINNIAPNTEKALKAAFKQNSHNKDEMISNMNTLLANPRLYDGIRTASQSLGDVGKEVGKSAKRMRAKKFAMENKPFKQGGSQGTQGSNE